MSKSKSLKDHLIYLSNCQTMEELWNAHCAKMAEYGFDRIMYGFTYFRSGQSLGDPDDAIVLSNHNKEYTDIFVGQKNFSHSPMMNWALQNEGAGSWNMLKPMSDAGMLTPDELRVYEINQKMGVTAGYTISFKSVSPRSKGVISLTAERGLSQDEVDACWAEHGKDILLMNNVAHLKILTLPYHSPTRSLTPRQREALEWVGDGKTTQDIAILMNLTPGTIEKHLRLAREVLSVETTAQAVLKAAFANQMFIMDR